MDIIARIEKHRALQIQYECAPANVLPPNEITPAAERASDEIQRALSDLSWSFIDRPPTTAIEAAALLRYVDERLITGRPWPDNRGYYDDGDDLDWLHALVRALGTSLASVE